MEFFVLASGSKGNCSVIKTPTTQVIVDCGMSWRYLTNEFARYQIDYRKSDALLITHTHGDHIAQLSRLAELPKYTTFELPNSNLVEFFRSFMINDLEILPLPLSHDCAKTTGYVISAQEEKLVYITDTGYLSEKNKQYLKNADYYILESNHDTVLLLNTDRPNMLKRRILFDDGHLSNVDCAGILSELIGPATKEIVLAHLSEEANRPEIAYQTLCEIFSANGVDYQNIEITIASQNKSCRGGIL